MFVSRIIFSSVMLNKMHANASPYLSPFHMWNLSNNSFCILTLAVVPSIMAWVSLTDFDGIPSSSIAMWSWFLLTSSYTVLKSINRWWVSIWNSNFFSKICLNVCIWSIVDTPSLNPHWYCLIILFACGFNLLYSTIDSTLYAVLTREIPLEFSQFWT